MIKTRLDTWLVVSDKFSRFKSDLTWGLCSLCISKNDSYRLVRYVHASFFPCWFWGMWVRSQNLSHVTFCGFFEERQLIIKTSMNLHLKTLKFYYHYWKKSNFFTVLFKLTIQAHNQTMENKNAENPASPPPLHTGNRYGMRPLSVFA